jgi:hypothetical protein
MSTRIYSENQLEEIAKYLRPKPKPKTTLLSGLPWDEKLEELAKQYLENRKIFLSDKKLLCKQIEKGLKNFEAIVRFIDESEAKGFKLDDVLYRARDDARTIVAAMEEQHKKLIQELPPPRNGPGRPKKSESDQSAKNLARDILLGELKKVFLEYNSERRHSWPLLAFIFHPSI